MQLKFLFDDLIADSQDEEIGLLERLRLERKARKVRQVMRKPRKMAKVEKFVLENAHANYVAQGRVGEFGDGAILDWFQNGGLEQILSFILGIMKGIADIFLVIPLTIAIAISSGSFQALTAIALGA